jgi:hypothetical protein
MGAMDEGDHLIDMMNSKQVVIDDAFDQVEDAPTKQRRAPDQFSRPIHVSRMRNAPQPVQSEHDEDVRHAVEDAVPQRVEAQIFNGCRGGANSSPSGATCNN